MKVVGVDPGKHCGIAIFIDGKLESYGSYGMYEALIKIIDHGDALVVFEDSRAQKNTWSAVGGKSVATKIARNVGMIDGYCAILEEALLAHEIAFLPVSPRGKGKKMNEAQMTTALGHQVKTNQHTRDAIQVALPYISGDTI